MKIALFGAGARGVQCLSALAGDTRFEIVRFFDNDPKKWNTTLNGIPIGEPTAKACEEVDAIILASVYAKEILAQLTRLGCAGKVALSPPHLARKSGLEASGDVDRSAPLTPDAERDRMLAATPSRIRKLAQRLDSDLAPAGADAPRRAVQPVACTICCNNYLAYATVLARSFLRHHPDGRFVICLADRRRDEVTYPSDPRIAIVEASELGIEGFASFAFKYDVLELNTAVKPFLLERLIEEGAAQVLYLDPDILVLAPLDELFDQLDRTPLILTPHLTQPYRDAHHPREIDILRAGTYNLGFVGVAAHPQTSALLTWWQERLYDGCTREIEKGYFVDQKWMDFVPSFFPDHAVIRDPGYNAAYWNLHERTVAYDRGRFTVNGRALRFFHFSGVDVNDVESVSKHQNRVTLPQEGALRDLFELYRTLLVTHDHLELKAKPYAYVAFDNGVRIPDIVRALYRETRLTGVYPNPFANGDASFYEWLHTPWRPGSIVSNLFATMRTRTPELLAAYPGQDAAGELALLIHLRAAAELYGLPPELVDPRANGAAWLDVVAPNVAEASAPAQTPGRLPRRVSRQATPARPAGPLEAESALRVTIRASHGEAAAPYPASLEAAIRLAVPSEGLSIVEVDRSSSDDRAGAVTLGCVELEPRRTGAAPVVDVAYWMWDESWAEPRAVGAREIWTPSAYSLEGLARTASVPVVDLPLPVGVMIAARSSRDELGVADERPLFVSVVDPVTRRGHDPFDTVRAFQHAFAGLPVEASPVLILVGTDPAVMKHVRQRVAPLGADPAVVQVRHVAPGPELVGMLCASDCYVSLHGPIAFDAWLATALWHGRPAVTTALGGVADVATVNNSFLVDVERDTGGDLQPDVAHAAALLRLTVECREERRNRGGRARRDVRATHSVEAVAQRMQRRLSILAGRQPACASTAKAGVS